MESTRQDRWRNQPRKRTRLSYVAVLAVPAALLFIAACGGNPAGGIMPLDSPVVTVALRWARSLQEQDAPLFASTINPAKLAPPGVPKGTLLSYSDVLVSTFARCGMDIPDAYALVTDGTRGRERYMVIGRYGSTCLQSRGAPATDTFVVYELTVDGTPTIDAWTFGKPPGS